MDREIVKELIQKKCTVAHIQEEIDLMLYQDNYRENMLGAYDDLIRKLGKDGCSEKIAQDLIKQYI